MSSWKPMAFCAAMSRRGSSSMPSAVACGICVRSEEHTSELQSRLHLVCRLLLEKKKTHADNDLVWQAHRRVRSRDFSFICISHRGLTTIGIERYRILCLPVHGKS